MVSHYKITSLALPEQAKQIHVYYVINVDLYFWCMQLSSMLAARPCGKALQLMTQLHILEEVLVIKHNVLPIPFKNAYTSTSTLQCV